MSTVTDEVTIVSDPQRHALPGTEDLNATELPITVIERRSSWKALDLRDIWRFRELLYFLTWRDIKIRYKQTAFGAAWAILQPLVTMIVFSLFFGRFVGLDERTGGIPYPVFVLAGLLPWTLFSRCMASAAGSVVASSNIITKIYFPRLLVPIASSGAPVVDFVIALVLLVGMMVFYQVPLGIGLLLLPVVFALTTLAALAIGIWLSALTVTYRDFQHVVPFLTHIWMFLTPVIYPVAVVPERFLWVMALNPLTGLVTGFRFCLLGSPLNWTDFVTSIAVVLVGFAASVFYFRRVESNFVDVI